MDYSLSTLYMVRGSEKILCGSFRGTVILEISSVMEQRFFTAVQHEGLETSKSAQDSHQKERYGNERRHETHEVSIHVGSHGPGGRFHTRCGCLRSRWICFEKQRGTCCGDIVRHRCDRVYVRRYETEFSFTIEINFFFIYSRDEPFGITR